VNMFNSTPADIFRIWSFFGIWEPFAFIVFLFCHPFWMALQRPTDQVFGFGLLCIHKDRDSITSGTHTSGA